MAKCSVGKRMLWMSEGDFPQNSRPLKKWKKVEEKNFFEIYSDGSDFHVEEHARLQHLHTCMHP